MAADVLATHWGQTKWRPFFKCLFHLHVLGKTWLNFNTISTDILPQFRINLGNGLASNMYIQLGMCYHIYTCIYIYIYIYVAGNLITTLRWNMDHFGNSWCNCIVYIYILYRKICSDCLTYLLSDISPVVTGDSFRPMAIWLLMPSFRDTEICDTDMISNLLEYTSRIFWDDEILVLHYIVLSYILIEWHICGWS